jgi:hypothetical protein
LPETATHPAVAPAIEALRTLADYQPESATDLADVLRSIHDPAHDDTLMGELGEVLYGLAEWSHRSHRTEKEFNGDGIAAHLDSAGNQIAGIGCHLVDWARHLTGRYHGSDGTVAR